MITEHTVHAKLVVLAESNEEAERLVSSRLRSWMKENFSHNVSIEKKSGTLIYWDSKKEVAQK